MIRLIQRRLIIPRGDTGSFSIPVLSKGGADNIAVFTIFDETTKTRMFQKIISGEGDVLTIAFTHSDTVNLKPGKYVWDIKYYSNPEFIDDELVNGEEVNSYYAGFSLPVCEIRETADNYLVSPEAPTATLSPEQLEIVTGAIHSLNEAIRKTQENVEHYPEIRDEVWYAWDAELGDYVNTGVRANGIVGNGIASAVLNDDYTLTLNFTDGTSFTSTSIRGETGNGIDDIVLNNDFTLTITYTDGESYTTPSIRGPIGATPQFSIGTVQDGAVAAASITGTAENPVLNLTLPNAHVPTRVSQLENDAGYLAVETDPTVPAWAKAAQKPAYTAAEVGAITEQEVSGMIAEAIGQINSFDMAVVQTLPTQDISTHTIYLVPKTGETNDVYDEYVYINNNWEMVGNTQIDLSDYALKSELPTKVSDLTDDSGHYTKPATGIPASDLSEEIISTINGKAPVIWENTNGSIVHFEDGADDLPVQDLTVQIEPVQAGSGDPSPDNVRPISGWTGANVVRCGGNLWKFDSSFAPTGYKVLLNRVSFDLKAGTYTFSAIPDIESDSVVLFGYHADGTRTEMARLLSSTIRKSATTTISKDVVSLYFVSNAAGTISDIQLELGSFATDYEPYQGETYDIQFPTEAGTVYGGTLDLTAGTLTVDRVMWTKNTSTMDNREDYPGWRNAGVAAIFGTGVNSYIITVANIGSNISINTTGSNDILYLGRGYYGRTETEWKALAIDVQVVLPLTALVTYQLTPTEIHTLLGQNNIWADTGDTAVTYRADTKMFVEQNAPESPVQDVQVNGVSVLDAQGVANVPLASENKYGVAKAVISNGIYVDSTGVLSLTQPTALSLKLSNNAKYAVSTAYQHQATFYGLAKAAGADMKDIANTTVGTYPDAQKEAIQSMLGVSQMLAPTNPNLVASQAYSIGDVFAANGHLYKATAAIAQDEAIIPDTNCVETTMVDAGGKIKDVQINSVSVVGSDGVANIPIANNRLGAVWISANSAYGLKIGTTDGLVQIVPATSAQIKATASYNNPIPVKLQHESIFYALSKVAGVDLANETVSLGTYPETSKTAIKEMLGVQDGLKVVRLI